MPAIFYYRARTPEGEPVGGSMLADGADAVAAHLRARALFVTTVSEAHSITGRVERARAYRASSPAEAVALFRSLATMVAAGVPLHRSLSVAIAQCASRRLAEVLRAVRADVEAGLALGAAMRRHPKVFAELYVATIEAGEAGGFLDDVLERLAALAEKDRAFRKKVGAALAYPAIVMASAVALTLFLIATIVPTFAQMFDQLGVPLPMPTRALLAVGAAMRSRDALLLTAAFAVGVPLGAAAVRRDRRALEALDRFRLALPLAGGLERKTAVARISRMLGSLLRCGVDLLRAIEIVAPVTGNAAYTNALRSLGASLREGDSVAEPLSRSPLFDPLVIQMVRVGEETGALDRMLLRIAEHYESDVEVAVAALGSTLEPILIGGVGVVVGGIVFSIFLPLYTMIGNIR